MPRVSALGREVASRGSVDTGATAILEVLGLEEVEDDGISTISKASWRGLKASRAWMMA